MKDGRIKLQNKHCRNNQKNKINKQLNNSYQGLKMKKYDYISNRLPKGLIKEMYQKEKMRVWDKAEEMLQ